MIQWLLLSLLLIFARRNFLIINYVKSFSLLWLCFEKTMQDRIRANNNFEKSIICSKTFDHVAGKPFFFHQKSHLLSIVSTYILCRYIIIQFILLTKVISIRYLEFFIFNNGIISSTKTCKMTYFCIIKRIQFFCCLIIKTIESFRYLESIKNF